MLPVATGTSAASSPKVLPLPPRNASEGQEGHSWCHNLSAGTSVRNTEQRVWRSPPRPLTHTLTHTHTPDR